MKFAQTRSSLRTLLPLLSAAILLFCLTSCSRKISFQTSPVVPAARGTVIVKKDGNKNYHIQISLYNLAEPNRLQPSRNTYVVWMESGNDAARNIGQINSSTGFFSSKLKASFSTVTPVKPSRIFLTAEDDGKVQSAGTLVILSTDSF